jgi:hypothetical protein
MELPELPDWTIELTEISAGVWRLQARHVSGVTFETPDSDPERALDRLREYVSHLGA